MSKVIHLFEVNSTNEYLKELLKKDTLEEGTVVVADFQTNGKGQSNSFWESEKGKNLTFSIVLYPKMIEAQEQFIISQIASLAIIDTLKSKIHNVSIKWPNDIYAGDKKIAGILIENTLSGNHIESCVIGIGLNVHQNSFHSNAPNPVSLKQLTKKDHDLNNLLKNLYDNILIRYTELINKKQKNIFHDYLSVLYKKNDFCYYKTKGLSFKARIKTVLPTGELVLENTNGNTESFSFKEIEFLV